MIVFNGSIYSNFNSLPENELENLFHTGVSTQEIIRVEAGKLVFWELHYFRMMSSMRILRIGIPMNFTMEYFEEQILKVIHENKLTSDSSIVNISFFQKAFPTRKNPITTISFLVRSELSSFSSSIQFASRSIELYKDHFLTKGLFGSLETSNNRLRRLSSVYAYENDFEDLILLNEDKQVTETMIGSLFLVQGNQIKTPPLSSGCRSSVYRQVVIDLLKKIDEIDLSEENISPFELQKSEELFVVSSLNGIHSVKQYRKKVFTSAKVELLFPKFIANYRLG
tara:strand:+ start:570 stop:1415 length:846 start_codon:yes stop_codon:yes gene_type:complete